MKRRFLLLAAAVYFLVLTYTLVWVPWSVDGSGRSLRLGYGFIWSGPSVTAAAETLPANFDFDAANAAARYSKISHPDYGMIGIRAAAATSCFAVVFLTALVLPIGRRAALVPTASR